MQIFWEIASSKSCNLNCLHCYARNNWRPDIRKLNLSQAKDIFDKINLNIWIKKIDILGWEPLTFVWLHKLISYIKNKNKNIFIWIVTNWTLLNPIKIKQLKYAKIDNITVSLDGSSSNINDKIRWKWVFKKAVKSIKECIKNNIQTTISVTVNKINQDDLKNIINFAKKNKVNWVVLQLIERSWNAILNWENLEINYEEMLKKEIKILNNEKNIYVSTSAKIKYKNLLNYYFNKNYTIEKNENCGGWRNTLMITSGWDILPCSYFIWKYNYNLLNKNLNIKKVIKEYRNLNKSLIKKTLDKFKTCKNCEFNKKCSFCFFRKDPIECKFADKYKKVLDNKILWSKIKIIKNKYKVIWENINFIGHNNDEISLNKKLINLLNNKNVNKLIDEGIFSREKLINFLCKLQNYKIIKLYKLKI